MAAVDWPIDLPQTLFVQGFAQREQTALVRTPMGYGPAKVRRRTTAAIQPVNGSMVLTGPEKDTLIDFYTNALEGGVNRFNWRDQLDNPDGVVNNVEYRFTSPIQWSARGPNIWLAVMNLEILP